MTTAVRTTADDLDDETVARYRRDGFIRVPGVFTAAEAAHYATAAVAAQETIPDNDGRPIFKQLLQVWRQDDTLRELTLDTNLALLATRLAGVPLRLWHDQLLIKPPHNGAATEFHQDQPYWPHSDVRHALSAWVALVDVPVERGCMSFIPGSQRLGGLRAQDLSDDSDLFHLAPELAWEPRVTIPLRAGDCTFHNSLVAHTAAPNATDRPRIAHVVAFVDADLTYTGSPHVVTDPLRLPAGRLPDEYFPRLPGSEPLTAV